MNGDQEVGILFTRHVRTAHHRDEVIAVTSEYALKHRIVIEQTAQLTRDGDGDVFLTRAARTNRARILSTVPGINRNDHFIAIIVAHRPSGRPRGRITVDDGCRAIIFRFKRVTRRF
ncbi:hypothetical protein D3C73_1116520 [compost metagenome]